MAEKQYKNYDERFLKEESSGSRPVIEYDLEDENEVINSGRVYLKGKFPDGSYCKSSQDIINLFISSPIISVHMESPENKTLYCSPVNVQKLEEGTIMHLYTGEANGNDTTVYVVDAPTFEQLKQSKSLTF